MVLITDATGHTGSFLTRHLAGRYDLVLTDARPPVEPPSYPFTQVDGISNNHWKRLNIGDARQVLGYAPEDDSFVLAGTLDSKMK